jgi:antitoxin component YwqK of YwqJK toxin-antitoxin module
MSHDDDGVRREVEYVNGVPNGIWRYWHPDGVCLRDGFRKNGQWHGTLVTRDTDGTVLDVSEFDEGTGVYRIFNSNKQMTDEIHLLHGKPHGVGRCWCFGKLVMTTYFDHGECYAAVCEAGSSG